MSILEIGDGVFEVKSTNGDTFLGGEDFDMLLVDYLAEEFKKDQGVDLKNDKLALQRLKEAAEKAKIELSSSAQTEVNLPFITADASGPKHLTMKLTRAKLESLVSALVKRTVKPMQDALKDAGMSAGEIDEVLLVGGMTRMPKIQETVKDFFGKEPQQGCESGRSCCHGRCHSGGRAAGRCNRCAAAGRYPAVAGYRNPGWRVYPSHRPQHDNPNQESPRRSPRQKTIRMP